MKIAREVTGQIYSVTNSFQSYFNLSTVNADLIQRMAILETEVENYKRAVKILSDSDRTVSFNVDSLMQRYRFIPARVINNSFSHLENFITLDKGSEDGIMPDMGVISASGMVGVVIRTSLHFSTVLSILNIKYKPSGSIKKNCFFGPLVWDGKTPEFTYLTEIPSFVPFAIGDTVVSSGYSAVFPEGIPIGTVVDSRKQMDDHYTSIQIRLFTHFRCLNEVLIVVNRFQQEQKILEESVLNLQKQVNRTK